MIVPVQKNGSRSPLFMVHGLYGGLWAGAPAVAHALGPDQPFYVLLARGLDGKGSPFQSAAEMAESYLRDIRSVSPNGPYRLGSICSGAVMAIELANALAEAGETIESLVLLDPQTLLIPVERYQALDQKPKALQQLYNNAIEYLRKRPGLIDSRDSRQLHAAASAAVATASLLTIHRPAPYSGACELIVSNERAPIFFQPRQSWQAVSWQEILRGPRRLHVLPGDHTAIFHADFPDVLRLMHFILDRDDVSELSRDLGQGVDGEDLAANHLR